MPTNWLQLDRPLLRYSAPVSLTIRSKSVRGINLSIWLNMLHDAFTSGLLRSGAGGFGDSPTPYTIGRPDVRILFWTAVKYAAETRHTHGPSVAGPMGR